MDRNRLTGYLEEGMSLIEIGKIEGRDPSTVGYWVQKHGLVANGKAKYAPRGGLTREQLEPLVEAGMTLKQIADELDRGESAVSGWLKRHGLKLRGRQAIVPREVVLQALNEGKKVLSASCPRHGETEFAVMAGDRPRAHCKRCRAEAVVRRRRKVKGILVEEAGGACVLCGYRRCPDALHFHHLDPARKDFGIAARGVTYAIDRLRVEAAKCALLCSNCHAEVEAGLADLGPLKSS